jgi:hypothetical protein
MLSGSAASSGEELMRGLLAGGRQPRVPGTIGSAVAIG